MNKVKRRKIIALIIILTGITIFTFPYLRIAYSDLTINSRIDKYENIQKNIDIDEQNKIMDAAANYNSKIRTDAGSVVDPFFVKNYSSENPMNLTDLKEEVGYVYIPAIQEKLPLYLGASEENLAKGLAQVDGTAIPMGRPGERPVIAGHRGYAKQAMFRHLDKLNEGDEIYIFAFGKILTYKVTDQEEIYPSENEKLVPKENVDMITLLTCTPYLQNYNRLLVNAVRAEDKYSIITENENKTEKESIPQDKPVEVKELKINDIIEDISKTQPANNTASRTKSILYAIAAVGVISWISIAVMLIVTIFSKKIK